MIKHGVVESNTRPDDIKLDEYSVWIAQDVTEVEMDGELLYRYDLTQYGKDEYILAKLQESQATNDVAIAELAEFISGVL